jgi:Tol biopolymer transport system component
MLPLPRRISRRRLLVAATGAGLMAGCTSISLPFGSSSTPTPSFPPHIWVSDVSGQNARDLLANQGFSSVRAPCFSADGKWLAFAGAGGPVRAWNEPRQARSSYALIGPHVAEADGIAGEIWIVRPDGSELRRLTSLQEHSPTPSWSPDGKWIAFLSESGLSVVSVGGKQPLRLKGVDGTSGLCWKT